MSTEIDDTGLMIIKIIVGLLIAAAPAIIILILTDKKTPYKWEGIHEQRICDFSPRDPSRGGVCLSGGKNYICVVDESSIKVVCQRPVVDSWSCINLVNAETVCPK